MKPAKLAHITNQTTHAPAPLPDLPQCRYQDCTFPADSEEGFCKRHIPHRRARIPASDARHWDTGKPMLVEWYDQGTRYGIGLRQPSMRRDVIKVDLYSCFGDYISTLKLEERNHELWQGTVEYTLYESRGKEAATVSRIMEKINMQCSGQD